MNLINALLNFIKESRLELRKVNWPSRAELVKYTLIVIGMSLVLAVFLGALDFVYAFILNKYIL